MNSGCDRGGGKSSRGDDSQPLVVVVVGNIEISRWCSSTLLDLFIEYGYAQNLYRSRANI